MPSLQGLRFLDAGSGSGLFSLAARRLGATVHSFDYDPQSVACTAELKRRYFPGDERWTIEGASVLDAAYLAEAAYIQAYHHEAEDKRAADFKRIIAICNFITENWPTSDITISSAIKNQL